MNLALHMKNIKGQNVQNKHLLIFCSYYLDLNIKPVLYRVALFQSLKKGASV